LFKKKSNLNENKLISKFDDLNKEIMRVENPESDSKYEMGSSI
jgi:hypothetical protein